MSKVPKFMEPGSLDNPLILNLLFLDISVTNSLYGFGNSLFINFCSRVEMTHPNSAFLKKLCHMIDYHHIVGRRIGCIDNGPKTANFKIELWYFP